MTNLTIRSLLCAVFLGGCAISPPPEAKPVARPKATPTDYSKPTVADYSSPTAAGSAAAPAREVRSGPPWVRKAPPPSGGRTYFTGAAQGYYDESQGFALAEKNGHAEAMSRIWTQVETMLVDTQTSESVGGAARERTSTQLRMKGFTGGELITAKREETYYDKPERRFYALVSVSDEELNPAREFLIRKHEQLFAARRAKADFEAGLNHLELLASLDRTPKRVCDVVDYLQEMQWWEQAVVKARLLLAEFPNAPEAARVRSRLAVFESEAKRNPNPPGAKPRVRGVKVGVHCQVALPAGQSVPVSVLKNAIMQRLQNEGFASEDVSARLGETAMKDLMDHPGVARGKIPDDVTHLALGVVLVTPFEGEIKAFVIGTLIDLKEGTVLANHRPELPSARGSDARAAAENAAASLAHDLGSLATEYLRK